MRPFIVLIALVASVQSMAEISADDMRVIELYLEQRTIELEVSEYTDARRFYIGNMVGDESEDVVVQYTLEGFYGGNNYYYLLAVFEQTAEGIEFRSDMVVGGKGYRGFMSGVIVDKLLTLDTSFSLPADPTCCPSGIGKAYFYVNWREELSELNVSPQRLP